MHCPQIWCTRSLIHHCLPAGGFQIFLCVFKRIPTVVNRLLRALRSLHKGWISKNLSRRVYFKVTTVDCSLNRDILEWWILSSAAQGLSVAAGATVCQSLFSSQGFISWMCSTFLIPSCLQNKPMLSTVTGSVKNVWVLSNLGHLQVRYLSEEIAFIFIAYPVIQYI